MNYNRIESSSESASISSGNHISLNAFYFSGDFDEHVSFHRESSSEPNSTAMSSSAPRTGVPQLRDEDSDPEGISNSEGGSQSQGEGNKEENKKKNSNILRIGLC